MTYVEKLRGATIKQGDTSPALRLKCYTEGDDPFNLTGYTATIKLRRSDGDTNKVDATATIEQPENGVVVYEWTSTDTDTAGVFEGELVCTNGTEQISFPNKGLFDIHIEEGL